jgi:hypothetical protein
MRAQLRASPTKWVPSPKKKKKKNEESEREDNGVGESEREWERVKDKREGVDLPASIQPRSLIRL